MYKELIKNWLRSTDMPLTKISRELNVSRNTLYSWMSGKSDIRHSNVERFMELYGDRLESLKGGESNMNDYYKQVGKSDDDLGYIGLLKDKIKVLQKENTILGNVLRTNPFSDAIYDSVTPDFETTVHLKYQDGGLTRTIFATSWQGLKKKTNEAVYQEWKEAIHNGVPYRMDEHPVNQILSKDTLEEIQGYSKMLIPILNAMKIMIGGGISLPITYRIKDLNIHTQCYMKIFWWENPHRVETRNVTMHIDKEG